MALKDLEPLKVEYIGKTFNLLTVIDVVRCKNVISFKCQCKCGNICYRYYKSVVNMKAVSCGCYHKSEEFSDKCSKWCKENPDKVADYINKSLKWRENPDKVNQCNEKHRQWFKDNPDKTIEYGKARSEYFKNNPDVLINAGKKISDSHLENRLQCNFKPLLEIIHPSYIQSLLDGKIKAKDRIMTKCPICGKYDYHSLHNVFVMSRCELKRGVPICNNCLYRRSVSEKENSIREYIKSFYSGECIRNSRDIISPLELDLYYPEKKIAIEFNGDYFHNEDHKIKYYHYNKFKYCYEKGITLVSVFESNWYNNKQAIKNYLSDLFAGIQNKLSLDKDCYMNNNYPLPINILHRVSLSLEDFYVHKNKKVYTCGYSLL